MGGGAELAADAHRDGWVCADAILLVRTGNRRYALTAALAYLGGLLFFEKSAVIPFVAFTVAALLCHVQATAALRTVAPRRAVVGRRADDHGRVGGGVRDRRRSAAVELGPPMTWDLLRRSVTHGIVPGSPAARGTGSAGPGVAVGVPRSR